MCEYRYAAVNLRRFPAAPGSGSPLGRRRVSPTLPLTLPLSHRNTDTLRAHTAPSPAPCPAARAEAEADGLPALPHCRSEAPAGSCSRVGCWGLCGCFFFFLSFFSLFFLPVSGWRPSSAPGGGLQPSVPQGLRFAEPQPRRIVPAWGQAQALPKAVPRATKGPHLGHATFLPWGRRP